MTEERDSAFQILDETDRGNGERGACLVRERRLVWLGDVRTGVVERATLDFTVSVMEAIGELYTGE